MIRPYYNTGQRSGDSPYYKVSWSLGGRSTSVVKLVIAACVSVFLLQLVLKNRTGDAYERFLLTFGFSPALAIGQLKLWQFVTYIFLHAGLLHIAFNLFFFYMVAGLVEERYGPRRFLWLFFISGIAGAAAQTLLFRDSATIGASAAVMGVAAACAALYPDLQVLFMLIIPIKMKHFLWVLVAFEILGAASAGKGGDSTAYFAHLGGLGAGYLFARFQGKAGLRLNTLYYRLRGRFRGFTGPGVTHIDDDEKYREEVDRLLDKIFREGTQSLTEDESDFLKRQSDKYKKDK